MKEEGIDDGDCTKDFGYKYNNSYHPKKMEHFSEMIT